LGIEGGFDLILSTATFHWIPDHDRLFRNLARALEPGGRLVAQCGGAGNISRVTRAIEEVASGERYRAAFAGWSDDKEYASAETTAERLERAGFRERETWLHDEPTPFDSTEDLARYLKTVVLGRHLQRLPEREHEPFAAAVARRVADYDAGEPPVMDYVRLNILARKPAA
jgi:trans-aconitate 2-methyltransferase